MNDSFLRGHTRNYVALHSTVLRQTCHYYLFTAFNLIYTQIQISTVDHNVPVFISFSVPMYLYTSGVKFAVYCYLFFITAKQG